MITQLVAIVAATLGLLLTVGDSTIAKPTCCAKRAYCCSIQARCCGKEVVAEQAVATLNADIDDEAGKPTCCIKRAYCCSSHRRCCPKASSFTQESLVAVTDDSVAGKPTCCIKRAYCCSIHRPCCPAPVGVLL